jgi:hypothetical protein
LGDDAVRLRSPNGALGIREAETIGPISFAERMPVASLAAKRSAVRNQAADCSLELQFAVWPNFGPGRSIVFNLARAFNELWLEIRLVL